MATALRRPVSWVSGVERGAEWMGLAFNEKVGEVVNSVQNASWSEIKPLYLPGQH